MSLSRIFSNIIAKAEGDSKNNDTKAENSVANSLVPPSPKHIPPTKTEGKVGIAEFSFPDTFPPVAFVDGSKFPASPNRRNVAAIISSPRKKGGVKSLLERDVADEYLKLRSPMKKKRTWKESASRKFKHIVLRSLYDVDKQTEEEGEKRMMTRALARDAYLKDNILTRGTASKIRKSSSLLWDKHSQS